MGTPSKASELTPNLINKSKKISQEIENIGERDFSYLRRGLAQPGGKLPLFDLDGQAFEAAVIRRCIARGWAEPWFSNPLKPDWLVCKLTMAGRAATEQALELRLRLPARAAS